MNNTKWTPGEWRTGPGVTMGRTGGITIRANGCTVAVAIAGTGRADANARLIAAASDLHAALAALLTAYEEDAIGGRPLALACDAARAALAKARGE